MKVQSLVAALLTHDPNADVFLEERDGTWHDPLSVVQMEGPGGRPQIIVWMAPKDRPRELVAITQEWYDRIKAHLSPQAQLRHCDGTLWDLGWPNWQLDAVPDVTLVLCLPTQEPLWPPKGYEVSMSRDRREAMEAVIDWCRVQTAIPVTM